MIARELRNATDRYIDLNSIRSHIEKSDWWRDMTNAAADERHIHSAKRPDF
jgi:hypothetical protein